MQDFTRYAIYYMPEPGPLADFGADWLGWDAQSGALRQPPALPGLPRPAAEITATPHKYGFHGTIKPPFRLAEGQDAADLAGAARALCAAQTPVELSGLALNRLGGFLALTPLGDPGPLAALAGTMVRGLDPFRAPPRDAELARRRKGGLSPRQEEYLQAWGYPHVMEEFRFHLTLSGRLGADEIAPTEAALHEVLTPVLPAPFVIRDLCLAGEDAEGRFHLVERLPLGNGTLV